MPNTASASVGASMWGMPHSSRVIVTFLGSSCPARLLSGERWFGRRRVAAAGRQQRGKTTKYEALQNLPGREG